MTSKFLLTTAIVLVVISGGDDLKGFKSIFGVLTVCFFLVIQAHVWPFAYGPNNWMKMAQLFVTFLNIFGTLLWSVADATSEFRSASVGWFLVAANFIFVVVLLSVLLWKAGHVFGRRFQAAFKTRKVSAARKQKIIVARTEFEEEWRELQARGVELYLRQAYLVRAMDRAGLSPPRPHAISVVFFALKACHQWLKLVNSRRTALGLPPIGDGEHHHHQSHHSHDNHSSPKHHAHSHGHEDRTISPTSFDGMMHRTTISKQDPGDDEPEQTLSPFVLSPTPLSPIGVADVLPVAHVDVQQGALQPLVAPPSLPGLELVETGAERPVAPVGDNGRGEGPQGMESPMVSQPAPLNTNAWDRGFTFSTVQVDSLQEVVFAQLPPVDGD